MNDYIKQLEQRNEELQQMLTKPSPWEPRWEAVNRDSGNSVFAYRNDYFVIAEVTKDFITYRAKFYVKTAMSYDLRQFHEPEEAMKFITEEIKGISWMKTIRKNRG